MSSTTLSEASSEAPVSRWTTLVLPVALLVVLAGGLMLADPAKWLDNGAPAAEEIAFERVTLQPGVFLLDVRNAANAPVTIAQVLVDDAFWDFTVTPRAELDGFDTATIRVEYPWVEGEPHVIGVMTNTGLVWDHEIEVALPTPVPDATNVWNYALIGLLVGFLPVAAGMAFYPAMRAAPARWTNALLALTLGLLAFLAIDTIGEGLELADELPGSFQGLGLFFGAAIIALAIVLAIERALRSTPWALAVLIAVGIGLHNLGEGLLIGSAFAIGSLALGTTLIVGFAIHNVTEGPAIVSPLARKGATLGWKRYLGLATIAGIPTVAGAWIGGFGNHIILPVAFFGLGAGAIVVVLIQVGGALRREGDALTPLNLAAFAAGYLVMLATGVLSG